MQRAGIVYSIITSSPYANPINHIKVCPEGVGGDPLCVACRFRPTALLYYCNWLTEEQTLKFSQVIDYRAWGSGRLQNAAPSVCYFGEQDGYVGFRWALPA